MNAKKVSKVMLAALLMASSFAQADGSLLENDEKITVVPQGTATTQLKLEVANNRSVFRIGEKIGFCWESSQDGYISLWDYGTNGEVKRIFPFEYTGQTSHFVQGGRRDCVPNDVIEFEVSGPTGREDVVLMYTNDPNQPSNPNYSSAKSFSREVERTIINRQKVKLTNISFQIVNPNENVASSVDTLNTNTIPITSSHGFQNVYVMSFGSNVGELRKTNDDASLFAKTVAKTFSVPNQNIKVYHDATRADFESGFRWLRQMAQPDDLILIHYSGHGVALPDDNGDEADGYDEALLTYEAQITQDIQNLAYYIRDDELSQWLKSINSNTVVMFLDACLSEGLYKSGMFGTSLGARNKFFRAGVDAFASQKGLSDRSIIPKPTAQGVDNGLIDFNTVSNGKTKYAMMTAARENMSALEVPRGGLFTLAFAENLQNPGRFRDWNDLFKAITQDVKRASNGKQEPILIDPDGVLSKLKF